MIWVYLIPVKARYGNASLKDIEEDSDSESEDEDAEVKKTHSAHISLCIQHIDIISTLEACLWWRKL